MFAVVKTGGKQYKVAKDDVIKVEKLDGEVGATIILDQVLAVTDDKGNAKVGNPTVEKLVVAAEVLEQKKDKKVLVFKKKRRHNYRRKLGHRQEVSFLKITDIGEGLKPKAPTKAAPKKEAEKKDTPKKAESKDAQPKKEAAKAAEEKAPVKKEAKTDKATDKENN